MLGFKRPSREQKRRSRLILRNKEYQKERLTDGHYCSLDRQDGSSLVVSAATALQAPVVIAWHPSTYRFLVSHALADEKPLHEVFHLSAAHARQGLADHLLRPGAGFRLGNYVFCVEAVQPKGDADVLKALESVADAETCRALSSDDTGSPTQVWLRLVYWTDKAENDVRSVPLCGPVSLGQDPKCNVVLPEELFRDVSIDIVVDSAGAGVRLTTKYDLAGSAPHHRLMLRVGSPTPLATGDSLYFAGVHHRVTIYGGSDHVVTKSLSLPNLPSEVTQSHVMVRARRSQIATTTDFSGTDPDSHSPTPSQPLPVGRTPPLAEIREVRRSNHDCTKDSPPPSSREQAITSRVANLTISTTSPRTPIHRSSRSAPNTDTSFLTPSSTSGAGAAAPAYSGRHPPSATPSPSLSSSRLSSPSAIYTPLVSSISPLLVSQHPMSDGGSLDSHRIGSGGRSLSRTGLLARGSSPPGPNSGSDVSARKGDASAVVLPAPPALRLQSSNDSSSLSGGDSDSGVMVMGREVPPSASASRSLIDPGQHIEEVFGRMESSPRPNTGLPHSQRLVMDSDDDGDDESAHPHQHNQPPCPVTPTHRAAEPHVFCYGTGQRPNFIYRQGMEDRLFVAEDVASYRGVNGLPLANVLTGGSAPHPRREDPSALVRTDVHEHAHSPNPPNMEDKWQSSPVSLFAALDGHGCRHVADFVAATLGDHVVRAMKKTGMCDPGERKEAEAEAVSPNREIERDGDSVYVNTLREAFAAISRHLEGFKESESGGTTIAACLIVDDKQTGVRRLITANLGDAQAVLCRNGKPYSLIIDHNCNNETEKARVAEAGGVITGGRLLCLNVTRSFGDRFILDCGKGFSNVPSISETVLGPDDEFIIISTDGLFRKVSDWEAVQACRPMEEPTKMVDHMLDLAINRGSKDNLACVVVRFAPAVPAEALKGHTMVMPPAGPDMMISVSPPRSGRGSRQGSFSMTSISSARSNETIGASDHEMSVGSTTSTLI